MWLNVGQLGRFVYYVAIHFLDLATIELFDYGYKGAKASLMAAKICPRNDCCGILLKSH